MRVIALLIIVMLFFSCTENPFFQDAIDIADGSLIRGSVSLSNGMTPDNVYVWLEGLQIGIFTDKDGEFVIALPAPSVQPGGGLSGDINLYYYCGNYKLAVQKIKFLQGVVQYGDSDVDSDGIVKPIELKLLAELNVHLEVNMFKVSAANGYKIDIAINNVTEAFGVNVFKTRINGIINNIFFIPVDKPNSPVLYQPIAKVGNNWVDNSQTMLIRDSTNHFQLPVGDYYVLPYLHIKQEVPIELYQDLDAVIGEFDARFLNIPYKRTVPVLSVIED